MDTEQARRLITLHDNADRALLNLRNAGAMSTDDPRARQLLEEAGDAYAESHAVLLAEQERVCHPLLKMPATGPESHPGPTGVPGPDDWSAPGKGVQIIPGEGSGAGFVEANVEGIADGNVAVRLTTPGALRGEQFPEGATVSVPLDCLTPADAASATETGSGGSGEGQPA